MRRAAGLARTLVLAAVPLTCFVHQTDTATAQGEAIFARAVGVAEHLPHAPYAQYAVSVSFTNGSRHIVDTWDTAEDITRATVYADIFSQEERRAPTVATGSNVALSLTIQSSGEGLGVGGAPSAPISFSSRPLNPANTGDPIGPVAFAVDQTFGLLPPRSYAVSHDLGTFAEHDAGFAVIGQTGTELARYRVALLDAGGTIDHLGLTPLRDPYHNRLRELWIDDANARVREAIVAGVGDRAPLDRVRWHVTFTRGDDGMYVAEEHALEPIDEGHNAQLPNLRIAFRNLTLTSRLPFASSIGISTPVTTLHDP